MKPLPQPLNIGAVLFPGFELLDLYGPLEMLGLLGDRVSIALLAENPGAISSSVGVKGFAEASLNDPGVIDLLLIPGGIGTRALVKNDHFLALLKAKADSSSLVATVCTGSALLAKTGLLDGQRATSNKIAFDWVREQGPSVHWVRQARWVEDGKYFTSSGISAGIDMTLGVISHLYGRETAQEIARRAEYLWNEDRSVDPFA